MRNPVAVEKEQAIIGISEAAGAALKQLLETKHLYQKVAIPLDPIVQKARKATLDACLIFDREMAKVLERPHLSPASGLLRSVERSGEQEVRLTLPIGNVKLFCSRCECKEAFRPVWYRDVSNELPRTLQSDGGFVSLPESYQLLLLVYQCQVCTPPVTPTTFTVRREGWDLFLEGRSPIEHVPVEPFIPKEERGFFRDAIVARNSGKSLAGLFYLRTFLEQFARRKLNSPARLSGDELMAAYADTIPLLQRDQMPSMREWYAKLSEAIHSANDDASIFDTAKVEIERHFDFRRLFRIS